MKKINITSLLLIIIWSCFGQADTNPVRIALIGTMHFEPSEVDLYANQELDINNAKRQEELEFIAERLAAFGTDRICIEYPMHEQVEIDSLYDAYRHGSYKLAKDEIDQIALRSAAKIGLEGLDCINYYGNFYIDSVFAYAQNHGQGHIVNDISSWGSAFTEEINSRLMNSSIQDFLCYLNADSTLMRNASMYAQFLSRIGIEDSYIGASLVAEWYKTNLHIYANLLRAIQSDDQEVVVLFGQGHITILRHLISCNPDLELVEVNELLSPERK